MTREEFLDKLRRLLRALPQDEIDAAVRYYDEYIRDAEDEAEALATLGSPREVAGRIAAEAVAGEGAGGNTFGGEDADGAPAGPAGTGAGGDKKRSGARVIFMVILAVFALPVGLPVAAVIAVVAVAVTVAALAALTAVSAAAVALIPGGLLVSVVGIAAMTRDFALGLAPLGTGLIAFGLGWLLLCAVVWLWRRGIVAAARRIGQSIIRRIRK
ncbi:MAG: DUF1700 domain-containing protein [Oscillospiraceae bacterium]|jgi:uncharacterized membrane protein|nr:DUF1700 domain-containing protein [Oscillospiraceae bacterium]